VFAVPTVVPGEDPIEFAALHSALIEELVPDGASEEDAVLTITKGIWRKRRVQRFIDVQLMINTSDPSHPSYDPLLGLRLFVNRMERDPETAFEEYASRCLRADMMRHLTNKFPRLNFDSTAKWAQAIISEIKESLLPKLDTQEPYVAIVCGLASSAATLAWDTFKQELARDERLDAMIDRAIKRLIQTKAMKQMLTQAGMETTHVRPTTTIA